MLRSAAPGALFTAGRQNRRPKAGARIWSETGEMVVQRFRMNSTSAFEAQGNAHFLFMGGRGCARVNYAGQTDGTIQ